MKKLSMIAAMALVLGSTGGVALAGSGSGSGSDEVEIGGHEIEIEDALELDEITELQLEAAEKADRLEAKIALAAAEGDVEKVIQLQDKAAEVAAEFAEEIAEEQIDMLDLDD